MNRSAKKVAVVDTNNPAELPDDLKADMITSIVDHHKLCGISTESPIEVDIRPLCSAGSVIYERLTTAGITPPPEVAGLILSCILSDSLEFRSPTTTEADKKFVLMAAMMRRLCVDERRVCMVNHWCSRSSRSSCVCMCAQRCLRPRYATTLAEIAGVDVHELAMGMFEAKADISHLSPLEIVNMDSKVRPHIHTRFNRLFA